MQHGHTTVYTPTPIAKRVDHWREPRQVGEQVSMCVGGQEVEGIAPEREEHNPQPLRRMRRCVNWRRILNPSSLAKHTEESDDHPSGTRSGRSSNGTRHGQYLPGGTPGPDASRSMGEAYPGVDTGGIGTGLDANPARDRRRERLHECIFAAVEEDGDVVGLAMGGPAKADDLPQTGAVYALYVLGSHHGRGLGRRLLQTVAADLAEHGMRALQIGCLAANAPARRFYEAIGGRLIGERLFDEDGIILPEVVYEWADITVLLAKAQPGPEERRSA